MIDTPTPQSPAARERALNGRLLTGLFSLLLHGAGEVSRVAGEMHGVIRKKPFPFSRAVTPDLANAPVIYQLLNLLFTTTAKQLHRITDNLPNARQRRSELQRMQSIMNGVFGDKLADWGHPGAIKMHLVDRNHQPTSLNECQQHHPRGVLLLIHGLCLSEQEWWGPRASQFCNELNRQGYGVVYLRYNSGLSLRENGALLARLLDTQWQAGKNAKLLMAGHSMGGLVARSALHHGRDIFQHPWTKDVSHAAYIASPHVGANLEKLGNFANNLLGYSPYTTPLMALGNIRSRGVRSLRQSHIHHENEDDANHLQRFNEQVHHLLIGALLADPAAKTLLGDGLVTDISAMGGHHFPEEHDKVTRLIINEVGHLSLLNDQRLYSALAVWLNHTGLNA